MDLTAVLAKWYKSNKRELPWRNTREPYIIWLSEIILQQTRVEQGLPYFKKFVQAFPTLKKFAKADENKILKLWQGLGYYSRARNMHYTARHLLKYYDGKFPQEYSELKKLKGIGEYTAAAIASFAFKKPHAVVDGNVYRFLSRYFGIKIPVDSALGKKIFFNLANELLDKKNPDLHNQAMMEFGAIQCKPFPDCSKCPLNSDCFAFRKRSIQLFPVKIQKQKVRQRFFNYLYIRKGNKFLISKRTGNDIWKNLYEFPLIETEKKVSFDKLIITKEWKKIFKPGRIKMKSVSTDYKHQLSHQTIHARFYEIDQPLKIKASAKNCFLELKENDLKNYGISRLMEKFLSTKFQA